MFEIFPKAIPDQRGCGERKPGGVYLECGLGTGGSPIESFLLDPPLPLPEGIDLVNKPQLWLRIDPASGESMLDPVTEQPIYDVLIWVGAEYYPEAPDYIEETRRLGASRRINSQMDLSKLTRRSRMLLAHPRAIIVNWRDLEPPYMCKKSLPSHSQNFYDTVFLSTMYGQGTFSPEEKAALYEIYKKEQRLGPCISKLWEVLPRDEAIAVFEREGELPVCLRRIGSTNYQYTPTGEQVTTWQPGFFAALPLTGIALIQHNDGSVNEKAKAKLIASLEQNKNVALPFYETDR